MVTVHANLVSLVESRAHSPSPSCLPGCSSLAREVVFFIVWTHETLWILMCFFLPPYPGSRFQTLYFDLSTLTVGHTVITLVPMPCLDHWTSVIHWLILNLACIFWCFFQHPELWLPFTLRFPLPILTQFSVLTPSDLPPPVTDFDLMLMLMYKVSLSYARMGRVTLAMYLNEGQKFHYSMNFH